jgi:hypothetical protein
LTLTPPQPHWPSRASIEENNRRIEAIRSSRRDVLAYRFQFSLEAMGEIERLFGNLKPRREQDD